jgi:tRNA A-37 threonylcarbamoyl transferase component Bud32
MRTPVPLPYGDPPDDDPLLVDLDSMESGTTVRSRIAPALGRRYSIVEEIGQGGSALVYLADDATTGKRVAIKVLRPELNLSAGEARFRREIAIESNLQHPNILPVIDVGEAAGYLYFAMPFVEGETLRERVARERQLRLEDVIHITREVAAALDYAHSLHVVHRDVKPGNILLDGEHVWVGDFGVARAMTVALGDRITESRVAVGTPQYMSPEQASGDGRLDARSDIYALGCVVYEMLTGEPLFTGPTFQTIVARHCHEPPRSIRIVRPAVPRAVEEAINRALAKVPADRFDTAGEFVRALDAGMQRSSWPLLSQLPRRVRFAAGAGLLAVGALAATLWGFSRGAPLDRNHVVVFPLLDPGTTEGTSGEGVATFIGYGLEGARPLRWRDGWELLSRAQRTSGYRLPTREARRLARRAGAAHFIDGSIVRQPDSVTVILRLHSVAGDSIVRLAGRSASAQSASLPQLGLATVRVLLPDLLAPGGVIDISALEERQPTAVANFLQGEREYRRMQFMTALPHYERALREDSAFALAALRGAYAASWLSETDVAASLVADALRNADALNRASLLVAHGLRSYLSGAADSAVTFLRGAIAMDSTVHGALTLLGEVYLRLLPREWNSDSLAIEALEAGRAFDPQFAPTLLLLEEIALRAGDVNRARALGRELSDAGADTTHSAARRMMLECVRNGPERVNWRDAVRTDHVAVLTAGKVLSGGASQPQCAVAAFNALLADTRVPVATRGGALLAIVPQLAATRRADDIAALTRLPDLPAAYLPAVYLTTAAAGAGFEDEARALADSLSADYSAYRTGTLWMLALYEARRSPARVDAIRNVLALKADSSGTARDAALHRAVSARLALLQGDTASAIRLLLTVEPHDGRMAVGWEPAASYGPEVLLLARLLLARGDHEAARRAATRLDMPEPVSYPLYLRESLAVRISAAAAMRNQRLADHYRRRLQQLDRH